MVSMPDALLPLFPLGLVLLPNTPLPLHIFEDRYKEMINAVLAAGSEFGVVLAAGRGIMPVGCTATIEEVLQKYDDGRMDIVTLGRRRFAINSVNQDFDYLRGDVSYFDDEAPPAPASLRDKAVEVCRALPDNEPDAPEMAASAAERNQADPQLSFQLARNISDLEFRQQLLAMRSESERLAKLIAFVPGYVEHARQAERLKEVAPKNGHGKHPPGLSGQTESSSSS